MPHTATLTKDRAHKPLAEKATVIGSQGYDRDGLPIYRLTLYQPFKSAGYEMTIDRATMLGLVASWMAAEARDAQQAAEKKEKERTPHEVCSH